MDTPVLLLPSWLGGEPSKMKIGKVVSPKLELKDSFVGEEIFAFFQHRWRSYKALPDITDVRAK